METVSPPSIELTPAGVGHSRITFSYKPERAEAVVFLAGDFNGWNPTVTPMERMGDGVCLCSLGLRI